MSKSKRNPVTLRLNLLEKSVLTSIVQREFGPEVRLEYGLRAILINMANEYMKAVKAQQEATNTKESASNESTSASDSDSSGVSVSSSDSSILAEQTNSVD